VTRKGETVARKTPIVRVVTGGRSGQPRALKQVSAPRRKQAWLIVRGSGSTRDWNERVEPGPGGRERRRAVQGLLHGDAVMWDDAPIQMPCTDGVFTEVLDRRRVVRAASRIGGASPLAVALAGAVFGVLCREWRGPRQRR
jgi:hypothetical protein